MPATPRKTGFCADCGSKPPGSMSKSRCDKCHALQMERGRRYRERHRERLLEADRLRWANDEEYRQRRAADVDRYRKRFPERAKAVVAARREKPEAQEADRKVRAAYWAEKRRDPEWRKKNNEYRQPLHIRRRARKRNAEGSFTVSEWRTLCATHGHRCVYCGRKDKLTVDHVIPLSRGGSNYIDNILPACGSCNSRKHTKTAEEFCPPSLF